MKFDINHLDRTYIIAEMSANHAGSMDRAKEIIRKAKEAGADCIKIQTYTPDTLTINCSNEYFTVKDGTWEGENLYGLYGKAFTPWEWQKELKEEADRVGIDFLSTPFDKTAVDFLEDLGLEFYKIASFEIVDLPLISYVASKQKPMIISTGMATKEEIKEALETVYATGNRQVALLKCSSVYPADPAEMHLSTIADMKESFKGVPIGLSDHSMGHFSAGIAVSMGAKIIEKHFCLGREIENPDASFSMTPTEFKEMVDNIREIESAMGEAFYGVSPKEEASVVFRRSIFAVEEIQAGDKPDEKNVRIIRPGYGIKPKYIEDIKELEFASDVAFGTPVSFDLFKKGVILFLTNNENTAELYAWLKEKEGYTCRMAQKITLKMIQNLDPSFIISFNYRYIIPKEIIDYMDGRIINLHISYLPYNRGSSPNFFSFYDNTPKGVTIHKMAPGLDTGDILCQKEVSFDEENETFRQAYDKLIFEIGELFKASWEDIKTGKIQAVKQSGEGSYHTVKNFHEITDGSDFNWDLKIADAIRMLRQ